MAQHNAGDTVEQMHATVREWTELLARIRFGTVKVAGKSLAGARIKAVAYRLANYADSDGTRVRPGIARVAVDVEVDYHTARRVIALLRKLGLLRLVRAGGRKGVDEFRLTLPVDLLDRDDLEVWSPSRQRLEIERVSGSHRGTPKGPEGPGGGESKVPEGSANDTGSLVPEGSAIEDEDTGSLIPEGSAQGPEGVAIADPSGTTKTPIADPSGTRSLIPQAPLTHHDLDTTTTHQPADEVRTAVTDSRVTGPATNPDFPTRPQRCDHGLPGGHRRDGKLACALCRVAADRATAGPPSAPAPHTPLADVIQFQPRRVS
ncbi:hypothetical protein [Actinoplanes rectilineatus]|uniref:hypothetical protein n=1 Tax=Actinoplanes rectilineatus TaxID=113571 RepID=UPI0005F28842|nr:hypothetical protein [Actinoplanes rectilineatus]